MATRKTRQSLSSPDLQFTDPQLNRLMQFVRGTATELQKLQQLLQGGAAGQVLQKSAAGDYLGGWGTETAGSITGAANLGIGVDLFAGTTGSTLGFRTLIAGEHIKFTVAAETITITGDVGGDGTVASVGITSTDLTVANSPITSTGDITLEIAPEAVTYGKIQNTTQDTILLGRLPFAGAGTVQELGLSDALDFLGGAVWGDILFRGTDAWEYLGPGIDGYRLTTHGIGFDPTWEPGGLGVSLEDPLIIGTDLFSATGTPAWQDTSICLAMPAARLVNLAVTWKLAWNQDVNSLLTTGIVLARTVRGSTTFIDSTPISFGASFTPTFAPGVNVSDAIAVSIDNDHDYYVIVHFDAAADPTAEVLSHTDTGTGMAAAFASGDHTTDVDTSAFTFSDTIYGFVAAWVVVGNSGFEIPLTTKGDILTFDGSALVRLGVGVDTFTIVADSTTATGLKWVAAGAGGGVTTHFGTGAPSTLHTDGDLYFDTTSAPYAGYVQNAGAWVAFGGTGGGVPSGTPVVLGAELGTASSGWNNFTITIAFRGRHLLQIPASWKFDFNVQAASASFIFDNIKLRRTVHGSTTFIDSTTLTFGGSPTPTLAAGRTLSDAIAVALDQQHDYYILMHVTSGTSAGATVIQGTDAVSELRGAFTSGDVTGNAAVPTGPGTTIYGASGIFVS